MWPATRPAFTATDVVSAAVSHIQDADEAARTRRSIKAIGANSIIYERLASQAELRDSTKSLEQLPELSKKELLRGFERLRDLQGLRQDFYDPLRLSGPFMKCVHCGVGESTTLDHVVSKKAEPRLATEPLNLVPSCSHCNGLLGRHGSSSALDEPIHAYFTEIRFRWLYADIATLTPLSLRFRASPPQHVAEELRARVLEQFKAVRLTDRYGVALTSVVGSLVASITARPSGLGEAAVRAALEGESRGAFSLDPNSLLGVVADALAHEARFCRDPVSAIRSMPGMGGAFA